MLIEFSVGNFRSFKDIVTLSMVAAPISAKDKELDDNNVFQVDDELRLLKSAAIYGANASGKSNLAKALSFMRNFILNSSRETQITDSIEVEPFALSTESEDAPSHFELVFILNGVKYRYGFEATSERVVAEWLFHVPSTRETWLFKRNDNNFEIRAKLEADAIQKLTRKNALFLSVSAQFNIEQASQILNYVANNLKVVSGLDDEGYGGYTLDCLSEGIYENKITLLLKNFDLGFQNIIVDERIIKPEDLPESTPEQLKRVAVKNKGLPVFLVETTHQKYNSDHELDGFVEFNLREQESEGTQKLFSLAAPLVDTLETAKTLIIDEFDARLHPLISREVIQLFNSNQKNPNSAQLIFMTHDTNLLSNKLFRRDQIWFVEKDRYGATDLYSLVEYKGVRNDASFEKDYIKGKYGAIPYIRHLDHLIDSNG
ncbi:MAG: ATP-binding protein [Cyanothece sp. SIO2G6]|nr:ATP-binding protein [Cyanothece sp. SIO2G6]